MGTDLLCAEASAAHTAKLQTQVTALDAKFANPVVETPIDLALKDRGSTDTSPQDASQVPLSPILYKVVADVLLCALSNRQRRASGKWKSYKILGI